MKKEIVTRLCGEFEKIARTETNTEYWLARELQPLLGYDRWENFVKVIEKAEIACENSGQLLANHFRDVTKMVDLGSSAQRPVEDIALTRYACYLVAQNGDSRKEQVAFAQAYFAVQTRKQEIIEQRLGEIERLQARERLTISERELSQIIFERVRDEQSFGRIRSKGDEALFGGRSTQDMKVKLGVPKGRPLADFLPTITIKAKDFANEITNFNIKRDDLTTEASVSSEHVKNNRDVRRLLADRRIKPEELPAAEDCKKLDRRVKSEQKKLPKQTDPLPEA